MTIEAVHKSKWETPFNGWMWPEHVMRGPSNRLLLRPHGRSEGHAARDTYGWWERKRTFGTTSYLTRANAAQAVWEEGRDDEGSDWDDDYGPMR